MNKLFEVAVAKVRTLHSDVQEQAARLLLAYAGEEESGYELTPNELADLAAAQAEMERGEFATDAEARAVWAKHGL